MELTDKEARGIIEGRVWVKWAETWQRFKKAWHKSTRFKVWVIAKSLFIISMILIALTLMEAIGHGEYSISAIGRESLTVSWVDTSWQLNLIVIAGWLFIPTGLLLLFNLGYSLRSPIDISKIIGEKSSRELAFTHYKATGELPPIPPQKVKKTNYGVK